MKTLFERGFDIVKELRAILDKNGHDADELLPMKSDAPFLTRLGALMHDTTANLAAKRIIEAKNELGVATFGAAGWATLSPEDRETFDGLCANHTRQLPVTAYDRLSKAKTALHELLSPFADEVRKAMGPLARVELDGPSFMRSVSKLLDPK